MKAETAPLLQGIAHSYLEDHGLANLGNLEH